MPRDLVAGIDSSTQSSTVVLRRIEDGAVVGFCSLVTRGTHIGPNEIWAGVPARFIRRIEAVDQS